MIMVVEGQPAPDFTLTDQNGKKVTLSKLKGSPVVVYFYPKDDTPGCTKEACDFRDIMDGFEDIDVLVVGISPDSPASHQKFAQNHDLNFPLLSDEDLSVCQSFDVLGEGNKLERTT